MIISLGTVPAKSADYRQRQEEILHMIDTDIERGCTGMLVAKALLESSRDWSKCEITYMDRFKKLFLEAINHGALAPDNVVGWDWVEISSRYNDPSKFMDDTLRFYDILADAGEHGITEAFDIIDMIWEPENCREED